MKRAIIALILMWATTAFAEVNVNINVNTGIPHKTTQTRPLPGDVPQVPALPTFIIQEPPDFLEPSDLGFFVAIGIPYDLYYANNTYYVYHNKVWFQSRSYNGPWDFVNYGELPPNLNKYRDNVTQIRVVRDREYKSYKKDRTRYRGHHFKPGKEWKEKMKEDKEEAKERRKEEKEDWKEEKRRAKEERKQHKKKKKHGDDDD
jgi:hypothetical protein